MVPLIAFLLLLFIGMEASLVSDRDRYYRATERDEEEDEVVEKEDEVVKKEVRRKEDVKKEDEVVKKEVRRKEDEEVKKEGVRKEDEVVKKEEEVRKEGDTKKQKEKKEGEVGRKEVEEGTTLTKLGTGTKNLAMGVVTSMRNFVTRKANAKDDDGKTFTAKPNESNAEDKITMLTELPNISKIQNPNKTNIWKSMVDKCHKTGLAAGYLTKNQQTNDILEDAGAPPQVKFKQGVIKLHEYHEKNQYILDFANKNFGGGVLEPRGWVQEEQLVFCSNLMANGGIAIEDIKKEHKNLQESPIVVECQAVLSIKTLDPVDPLKLYMNKQKGWNTIKKLAGNGNLGDAFQCVSPPVKARLLAAAAPDLRSEKVIKDTFDTWLETCKKAFSLLPEGAEVHTGLWGTGIFEHAPLVSILLQIHAAKFMKHPPELVFHIPKEEEKEFLEDLANKHKYVDTQYLAKMTKNWSEKNIYIEPLAPTALQGKQPEGKKVPSPPRYTPEVHEFIRENGKRIEISGRNNDCLYCAIVEALKLSGKTITIKDLKKQVKDYLDGMNDLNNIIDALKIGYLNDTKTTIRERMTEAGDYDLEESEWDRIGDLLDVIGGDTSEAKRFVKLVSSEDIKKALKQDIDSANIPTELETSIVGKFIKTGIFENTKVEPDLNAADVLLRKVLIPCNIYFINTGNHYDLYHHLRDCDEPQQTTGGTPASNAVAMLAGLGVCIVSAVVSRS